MRSRKFTCWSVPNTFPFLVYKKEIQKFTFICKLPNGIFYGHSDSFLWMLTNFSACDFGKFVFNSKNEKISCLLKQLLLPQIRKVNKLHSLARLRHQKMWWEGKWGASHLQSWLERTWYNKCIDMQPLLLFRQRQ